MTPSSASRPPAAPLSRDLSRGLSAGFLRLPMDQRHAIACESFRIAETEDGRMAYSNAAAAGSCPTRAKLVAMLADDKVRKAGGGGH